MPVLSRPLTEVEVDALREIANIGTGNAVTSLAVLTGETFGMSVPAFGVRAFHEFADILGDQEALAVAVYVPVDGDVRGHAACLFPYQTACRLADALLARAPGETMEMDEIERSAVMELGNIIVSSFLNAMSAMTDLVLPAGLPAFAMDMTGAILGSIAAVSPDLGDHGLTVMTRFAETSRKDQRDAQGVFVFIPEPASLSTLFHALGI